MGMNKKWLSVELDRGDAEAFRAFLRVQKIKYEASSAWDRIHFEAFANESECKMCDEFLEELWYG